MDLEEFQKKIIKDELYITKDYGKIFSFIDFSNVNRWFEKDNQDWNNTLIKKDERISIDIDKLKSFSDIFSIKTKIYYGEDLTKTKSLSFTNALRIVFGGENVVTKDLQRIKHVLGKEEGGSLSKYIKVDISGNEYIETRKCNFDVEISVDAIKMIEHYDTFCIFSGDADFVYLNNFLKKKRKKIIIIKAGYIASKLKDSADLIINAQNIKKKIAKIEKQKPD